MRREFKDLINIIIIACLDDSDGETVFNESLFCVDKMCHLKFLNNRCLIGMCDIAETQLEEEFLCNRISI